MILQPRKPCRGSRYQFNWVKYLWQWIFAYFFILSWWDWSKKKNGRATSLRSRLDILHIITIYVGNKKNMKATWRSISKNLIWIKKRRRIARDQVEINYELLLLGITVHFIHLFRFYLKQIVLLSCLRKRVIWYRSLQRKIHSKIYNNVKVFWIGCTSPS